MASEIQSGSLRVNRGWIGCRTGVDISYRWWSEQDSSVRQSVDYALYHLQT